MKKTTLKLKSDAFYSINLTDTHLLYQEKAPVAMHCLFKCKTMFTRVQPKAKHPNCTEGKK